MNKIKSLTQILLSVYLFRLLLTGASIGDSLVILCLSGLYGYYLYSEDKKIPEANVDIKNRLLAAEKQMEATNNKLSAMQLRR